MLLSGGKNRPQNTTAVFLPVKTGDFNASCLLYTTTLEVEAERPAVLVLPFMKPRGSVAAFFSLESTVGFRSNLAAMFADKQWTAEGGCTVSRFTPGTTGKIAVFLVEDYASLQRVKWSTYGVKEENARARLAVLETTAQPHLGCLSFVVAVVIQSLVNAGFGLMYPGNKVWFPTLQEGCTDAYLHDFKLYACNTAMDWVASCRTQMHRLDVTTPLQVSGFPSEVMLFDASKEDGIVETLPLRVCSRYLTSVTFFQGAGYAANDAIVTGTCGGCEDLLLPYV